MNFKRSDKHYVEVCLRAFKLGYISFEDATERLTIKGLHKDFWFGLSLGGLIVKIIYIIIH